MSTEIKEEPKVQTRKSTVLIMSETNIAQLNEIFDKAIPPAYSRPIIALLKSCETKEIDVPIDSQN